MDHAAFSTTASNHPLIRDYKFPLETWEEIFKWVALDPPHALAKMRLICRDLGALADRIFASSALFFYPKLPSGLKCIRNLYSGRNGLVKELKHRNLGPNVSTIFVQLRFGMFTSNLVRTFVTGLNCMSNLRTVIIRCPLSPISGTTISAILSKVTFPRLKDFSFYGYQTAILQEFIERHSSTLQRLYVSGLEPLAGELASRRSPFTTLEELSVNSRTLAFLLRCGLPVLRLFESPLQTTPLNIYSIGQSLGSGGVAASLQKLELYTGAGYGEYLFVFIAKGCPNLTSLVIQCIYPPDDVPGQARYLSDTLSTAAVLSGCAALTKLTRFYWTRIDESYPPDLNRGWEFISRLQRRSPSLLYVALPESGFWYRVHGDIWMPSCTREPGPCKESLEWAVDAIYDGTYTSLSSLLCLLESKLKGQTNGSVVAERGLRLIEGFKRNKEVQVEEVQRIIDLASGMKLFDNRPLDYEHDS